LGGAATEVAAGAFGSAAAVLSAPLPVGLELVQPVVKAMRATPVVAIASVQRFMEGFLTF
jgi:ABC-type nitrate/sulfonate/bicarbonate transport system permease component